MLLDVEGDRYIALSVASAAIWRVIAQQQDVGAAARLLARPGVSIEQAQSRVTAQLKLWSALGLVGQAVSTPLPEQLGQEMPVERELGATGGAGTARLVATMLALVMAERRYSRLLATSGLAAALVTVQSGLRSATREGGEEKVLRAYYAWRRMFRQGPTARDCLTRSLALVSVLRRRRIACSLCLGFIGHPFAAHAWVEGRATVLNETLAERRRYRVIGRY